MRTPPDEIKTHAAEQVTRFGRDVGIDLQLDETGNCYFEHRNGIRMAIMLTGDSQLVTAVALLSEVNIDEEHVGKILTDFNWLGTRVQGATLSWNPRSRNFLLWYSRDANEIKLEDLGELLTRLMTISEGLKPELESRIADSQAMPSTGHEGQRNAVNWMEKRA